MREALAQVGAAAQRECGGRAIPADKVHITLFFLGNVERDRIPELEALAREIRARAFELTIDVVDWWRHNRIVWAGTRVCPEPLAELAETLSTALAALRFSQEDRLYVPHVTLVRKATRKPRNIVISPMRWPVHDFALVESVAEGAGNRYHVVARWPLVV
jgi:2'-5' RNA ligase